MKDDIFQQIQDFLLGFWRRVIWVIKSLPPMNPAGWPFVFIAGVVTIVLALIDDSLFVVGAFLTAGVACFFRDPVRVVPQEKGLVIAPADGLITAIEEGHALPAELAEEFDDDGETETKAGTKSKKKTTKAKKDITRISIFLSVMDVHVNRTPVAGTVEATAYRPGKFVNASMDKASIDNERASTLIKTEDGTRIAVVQIAGLIARRILRSVSVGQELMAGERIGLIRFGSRVDIYVPSGSTIPVSVGQRAVAGETVIADLEAEIPGRIETRSL